MPIYICFFSLLYSLGIIFVHTFVLFFWLIVVREAFQTKKRGNLGNVPNRSQKNKMLSIVVLNMAKYTIISLILTDFVPIFFIFNLFRKFFRGSFRLKKVPSPKLILGGGGVNPFQKSPKFKKVPTPLGGGHVHFGLIPKFGCFFNWKASLSRLESPTGAFGPKNQPINYN